MSSGTLCVHVVEARGLPRKDYLNKNDPYVVVRLSHSPAPQKTRTIHNGGANPRWHQELRFEVTSVNFQSLVLSAEAFDHDKASKDDPIGRVDVPLTTLTTQSSYNTWHQLRSRAHKIAGELHLEIIFRPTHTAHLHHPQQPAPHQGYYGAPAPPIHQPQYGQYPAAPPHHAAPPHGAYLPPGQPPQPQAGYYGQPPPPPAYGQPQGYPGAHPGAPPPPPQAYGQPYGAPPGHAAPVPPQGAYAGQPGAYPPAGAPPYGAYPPQPGAPPPYGGQPPYGR